MSFKSKFTFQITSNYRHLQRIFLLNYDTYYFLVCKKKPVHFDDELKIGDVRYVNMIKITIKVQLF